MLAVLVLAGGVVGFLVGDGPEPGLTWLLLLGACVAAGAVGVRRRWPVPAVAVTVTVLLATMGSGQPGPALLLAVLITVYTVGAYTDRRVTLLTGAAAAAGVVVGALAVSGGRWSDPGVLIFAAWIGFAAAIGDGVRSRRAYVSAVEERARRIEQTHEEEARRRVAEERVRIARELHDVVAHHVAVINVQSGVAAHLLPGRPEQAVAALEHIRAASRAVLEELSSVLAVLRGPQDESPAPTEPTPGLADLDQLVERLTAAGMALEFTVAGLPRPLPAASDLAAYRVIQESLTNAHKHGAEDSARLTLHWTADTLEVEVVNPVTAGRAAATGGGHGLLGMRERTTALGGQLSVEPGPARFRVRAVVPAPSVVGSAAR
ncbi:putative secreted protein with PEP-CTERM sorting signal [Blastococcus colisei]|uniref:histidine kinase n=1 Tax=Blastococcus colisei TaxID=1564162 RepID=A0A543PJ95_9ACTN|nr:putative secreted protein with PEP-CTERM sorting signal [Blastococcus colisei]